ncbi:MULTISPECIES: YCF48-related protein [Methylomonas]|uniref:Photosynthesis system II assembly factor Ycf48/Hcf136-like domain-containing protein n=2 Tax=Methylomonas TaxID=416 RepID=A0A126T5R4_9GAMM|nr:MULTISPECIES: YCF48-related protein [Methylomonas]AMK77412.1 hypothetical protein JT25_013135 [Methylomonas denitrificans]OAI05004.1 hypothetical protein A1342_11300 [Methylomonas methanica]TCV84548.1 photosystem II stability/assembly factor-like uncharacterized protein [Methylomonas methanica]
MSGLKAKKAGAKTVATTSAAGHWQSRPALWLGLALMLALLSTVGAFRQAPHPNAYRSTPVLPSWDYWRYPVERNAFRRLPAIAGNLNDLAVSDDGQHIWAVGSGGLIVYSQDGGVSWRQGQIGPPAAEALPRASSFWINEAQAGMPPELQQKYLPAADAGNSIPNVPNGESNYANAPARQELPVDPKTQSTQNVEQSKDLPAIQSNALPKQTFANTVSESVPDKNAPTTVKQPVVAKQQVVEIDPKSTDLRAVAFTDTLRGWAAGNDGVILSTTDGGGSWQIQRSGTKGALNSIYFTDSLHGWVVGSGGIILATGDGGKSWQSQTSGTTQWLCCVKFTDNLHGWATGANGLIVATTDGGQTWQPQAGNLKHTLNGVTFIDGLRGWTVGEAGAIVATGDGGNTWQAQSSGSTEHLNSVQFLQDNLHGWATGDNGVMVATMDGGRSWQTQNSGTSSHLLSVDFLDEGLRGWAVGDDGTILATSDGGSTWQVASQKSLTRVQFLGNRQQGWAVGADGLILATDNGGQNWQVQPSRSTEHLFGLQFLVDGSRGWVAGHGGSVLNTLDGGRSWQVQASGVDGRLYRVQFLEDGLRGWAVGDSTLITSRTGGQNWQQKTGLRPETLGLALHFQADGQRGWIAGDMDRVYFTADSGGTWQSQVIGSGKVIADIHFQADGQRGWAVGRYGTILATLDGGKNWRAQASFTKQDLWGLAVAGDGSRGWAIGDAGTVLATRNGGENWQLQASNTSAFLTDIHGDHEGRSAWIVGAAGTILATSDGGEHWQDPVLPYQRYPAPWYYLSWLPVLLLFGRGLRLQLAELREPEAHDPTLGINPTAASDKPTGPGSRDYLGSLKLAQDLSAFLRNENTQPPLTLAITGDWGSGKSSVMNYLQAELRREGLRPVWYNAWHHQEEQQVLGSILECVRRQATPPLWPWLLPGLWFRLRLLTHRRFWLQLLAALLLTGFCWLATFSYFHEESEESQVWHYVSNLIGLEQPAVLTAQGHARLCGQADGVTNPAKPPADKLFSATDCEKLQCLVNADASGIADRPANCIDTLSRFASDDGLLEHAGKLLGHELTQERKQAIVKQLEHSPGKAPFALPAWLTALLTVLTTVAGVVVVRGASLFGLASTDLLKTAISKTGVIETAEPVGTRQIWERRFERLTNLLGRRRLVLFIDDLDRCSRDHALRVLETCNFLVSSGELFIVMGIAPKYVLANVKLHFRELAEALHEFDDNGQAASAAAAQAASTQKPRSLARFYLQKLINIEVPVPTAGSEAMLNMLTGNGGEEDSNGEREQRLQIVGNGLVLTLQVGVLLAAMGWAAFHASQPILVPSSTPILTQQAVPVSASNTSAASVEPETEKTDAIKAVSRIASFRADFKPEQLTRWPQRIGYGLLLLFILLVGCLVWVGVNEKARNWLVDYLEMAYKALGRDWFGPRQTQDTPEFAAALRIWYPLIHETQAQPPEINSPRTVKAFLNRLRCFASRWPKKTGEHGEAQLVALAALHFHLGEDSYERAVDCLMIRQDDQLPRLLSKVFAEHTQRFGPPSDDDCRLFKYFIENLEIHKPQ